MKQAPTMNTTIAVKPDVPEAYEQQVTLLLSGMAPAGAEIALNRKARGADTFYPVKVDGVNVVFTPDSMDNDCVIVKMQVDEIEFEPNATFTSDGSCFFGFKIDPLPNR